jgi:hypothetical protein
MKRIVLVAAAWASLASVAAAQEAAYQEELNFVQRLRGGDYKDLAEQYLQRLEKTASPELKAELPLEMAKTRLSRAGDESDPGRRLALYTQARADLKAFIAANPAHPRVGEAKLDMANVDVRQGKAQLSRALADPAARRFETPDLRKARKFFEDAARELEPVNAELQELVKKYQNASTPKEKALKARAERDALQGEYDFTLNLFDQAQTYPKLGGDAAIRGRNDRVLEAQKRFDKLSKKDETQAVMWLSLVWLARCDEELGKPKDARAKYADLRTRGERFTAAADAVRLARYFDLLTVYEQPNLLEDKKLDPNKYVEQQARAWISAYPRYLSTPEGYGVRYVLAEVLLVKTKDAKPEELEYGRNLIREIELTENEYTDRARNLKIQLISKQGGFSKPIADLKKFEDCYIRAQYEIDQAREAAEALGKAQDELQKLLASGDMNKIKSEKDTKEKAVKDKEQKRKTAMDNITAALIKAVESEEARGPRPSREVYNAQVLLIYFYLDAKKYREAARLGKEFAEKRRDAPQAALAAGYALEALSQQLAQRQRAEPPAPETELTALRKETTDWAQYVAEHWARDPAGDAARFQLALFLLADKKLAECMDALDKINPTYPEYTRSQFLLYETAGRAAKEGVKPPGGEDPSKYWTQRGLEALRRIPDATGTTPLNNYLYMLSRLVLTQDLFRSEKYAEAEAAALAMQARLRQSPPLLFSDVAEQNDKAREYLANSVADLRLRGVAVKVQADFKANRHDKAAPVLNELVKEINEGKWPELKANMQLGGPLLNMALKSNLTIGQLEPAREVLKAMKSLTDDAGGDKTAETLKLLAALSRQLLDDVKARDPAGVEKTRAGLVELLNDALKDKKDLKSEAVLATAQVYAALDLNGKAADELARIKEPEEKAPDAEKAVYHGARILYARQLRLLKDLDKADAVMTEMMGAPGKPAGWGRRSVEARKEQIHLLEAREKWREAAAEASSLMGAIKDWQDDLKKKEDYYECNYHVVLGVLRSAQQKYEKDKDKAKYEKEVRDAARFLYGLEVKAKGFGTEASEKRFKELLSLETDLRAEYEKQKK